MIDDLAALRLQLEWGADEALGDRPVDRFTPKAASRPASPTTTVAAMVAGAAPRPAPQAQTLDALHAELDAFTACPLRATATNTVRPDGAADAAVVVIADAPGSDDDRSGRAFSGEPGKLFDRVFGSIGLDRRTVLLTSLVPWRPPGNRPASESEVQACLPFVRRLLGIVRPRRLVLLGAGPVAALSRQTGTIRQLRGRWIDVEISDEQLIIPSIPMLPLAQWLRDGVSKQQVWSDLMFLQSAVTTT